MNNSISFYYHSIDRHHKVPLSTITNIVLIVLLRFAVSVFLIAIFCMKISPAACAKVMNCMPGFCLPAGHGEWRTTFSLHAFVAGALHFGYVIMASEKQRTINKIARLAEVTDSELPNITICAIVFAALAAALLFFICIMFNKHMYVSKVLFYRVSLYESKVG